MSEEHHDSSKNRQRKQEIKIEPGDFTLTLQDELVCVAPNFPHEAYAERIQQANGDKCWPESLRSEVCVLLEPGATLLANRCLASFIGLPESLVLCQELQQRHSIILLSAEASKHLQVFKLG